MRQAVCLPTFFALTLALAIPAALKASEYPISLPAPSGNTFNFVLDGFTFGTCNSAGGVNTCDLSGSGSINWDVNAKITDPPGDFGLTGLGDISAPAGTTVTFSVNDGLLGDTVAGTLSFTTWSKASSGDTILDATLTATTYDVTSLPGVALLGATKSPAYYLQIDVNCGSNCVQIADPQGTIESALLSNTPFATPEPRMVILLAAGLLALALLRRRRSPQVES